MFLGDSLQGSQWIGIEQLEAANPHRPLTVSVSWIEQVDFGKQFVGVDFEFAGAGDVGAHEKDHVRIKVECAAQGLGGIAASGGQDVLSYPIQRRIRAQAGKVVPMDDAADVALVVMEYTW